MLTYFKQTKHLLNPKEKEKINYLSTGFTRIKFIFLYFLILLFSVPIFGTETIKISILSKNLKKPISSNYHLRFEISGKAQILHENGELEQTTKLILQKKKKWSLITSSEKINFDIQIFGDSLTVWEEDRVIGKYPLPARITSKDDYPLIIVEENLNNYAIDSAMAELGLNAIDTREALFSIAYIILARAKSKQQNEFGYHFTDLTSHQKYFGKLISDQISLEEEDWEIDYRKWKGEFFFHSRSGGMTFSQSVFSERKDISPGVKDILYSTNLPIDNPDDWTARIETKEMMQILHFQGNSQELLQLFQANRKEKIRLQINRVKGWNFLKSNYYSVSLKKNSLLFTGKGLGHNVGLNMNGAIVLSKMGFNRFEILEHYFPQISFVSKSNSNLPTNLSYALLSNQGDLLYTSYPYFLEKSIPPGSLMKLIVSFIFLKDKGFEMTRFNCVPPSSTICWKKEGHGELNLEGAIANSCNSYFAFLANAMPYMIFKTELNQWISRLPMENFLPNKISQKGYQRIMSGLDFNMKWKIKDIMQLLRYLMKSSPSDESREKMKIYLHETFQIGTASKFPFLLAQEKNPKSLWGKTSTIVYGSNEPLSYGIFMGGDDRYGIILLYRKGNGNKAAYYAKKILESK